MELHSPGGADLRQLAIVLPLQVSDNVPIPFILNTGAPGSLYLGTEALRRRLNLSKI